MLSPFMLKKKTRKLKVKREITYLDGLKEAIKYAKVYIEEAEMLIREIER